MNQLILFILYILALSSALLIFRKRLVFDKFAKIGYIALIRTKFGLRFISAFAKKFQKLLHYASYASVFLGFAGMFFVSFDIIKGLSNILAKSTEVSVGVVLPIDVKGAFYVPFDYWLISIIAVMIVHEASHGIFARLNKIPLKSTGVAILGIIMPIIPGAFVDVDETVLSKKSLFAQLSVFSAGPFANIIAGFLFLLLMFASTSLINQTFFESGVLITEVSENSPAKITGLAVNEVINNIDGKAVSNIEDFKHSFEGKRPNDVMSVNNKKATLKDNAGRAYLGVFVEQDLSIKKEYAQFSLPAKILLWTKELLFWLFAINLGVGVFNLLPLGALDGGRMFRATACRFLHHKHAKKMTLAVNVLFSALLLFTILYPFIGAHL